MSIDTEGPSSADQKFFAPPEEPAQVLSPEQINQIVIQEGQYDEEKARSVADIMLRGQEHKDYGNKKIENNLVTKMDTVDELTTQIQALEEFSSDPVVQQRIEGLSETRARIKADMDTQLAREGMIYDINQMSAAEAGQLLLTLSHRSDKLGMEASALKYAREYVFSESHGAPNLSTLNAMENKQRAKEAEEKHLQSIIQVAKQRFSDAGGRPDQPGYQEVHRF